MVDDSDEDDIIKKYLPIFLSLKKEAKRDADKYWQSSQQSTESEIREVSPKSDGLFSDDGLQNGVDSEKEQPILDNKQPQPDILNDDITDSIFEKIPDFPAVPEEEEEFPSVVRFPYNSHLHKRRVLAEKRARYKAPVLFIKDIISATNWRIFSTTDSGSLLCNDLYDNDLVIFSAVTVRATVVGVDVRYATIIVDDGTGIIQCYLDVENFSEKSENPDISPIIKDFSVPKECLRAVTSPYAIQRGEIVQITGKFGVYYNTKRIYVNKIVRETEVVIIREIAYIKYVKALYKTYWKWKLNY